MRTDLESEIGLHFRGQLSNMFYDLSYGESRPQKKALMRYLHRHDLLTKKASLSA